MSVVIITGGASGIGLATAVHMQSLGWQVAIFDVGNDAIAACKRQHESMDFLALKVDITDVEEVDLAFNTVLGRFGRVDGLVNSAGIGVDKSFLETTPEDFRKLNEVNVIGTFNVSKVVVQKMVASGTGSIVNLSSVSGMCGNSGRSAYGASKGGIIALTMVMAVELAKHGIRVNAVAPGPIETPMVSSMHTSEMRAIWHNVVPQARYAAPSEIASVISFLLSNDASFITGQNIPVDGGFSAAGIIEG